MKEFLLRNWAILVPAVMGFVALYVLMPRARQAGTMLAVALGAAALAAGGVWLVHRDMVLPEMVLFYAFAGMAVAAGGVMITHKNAVYSALAFALVVLSTSGLFLLLAAPFLMAATIIVYAGAIVVTFLFVIMLAQQAGLTAYDQQAREPMLGCVAGFLLLTALMSVLQRNYDTGELDRLLSQVDQVAKATSVEEANKVFGAPGDEVKDLVVVDQLKKYFAVKDFETLDNVEEAWAAQDLKKLRKRAESVLLKAEETKVRRNWGGLRTSPSLPVSKMSVPIDRSPTGERLPAGNVAALGRSLYSDYLVPVGLAAFLLLVASIGAIAIAGRGREGLR